LAGVHADERAAARHLAILALEDRERRRLHRELRIAAKTGKGGDTRDVHRRRATGERRANLLRGCAIVKTGAVEVGDRLHCRDGLRAIHYRLVIVVEDESTVRLDDALRRPVLVAA